MSEPHYGALWEMIEQERRNAMTTPPPGSREAAQALADRLEAHTEQMANTSWGLTMQEWNVISNDILLAARTLRAALQETKP